MGSPRRRGDDAGAPGVLPAHRGRGMDRAEIRRRRPLSRARRSGISGLSPHARRPRRASHFSRLPTLVMFASPREAVLFASSASSVFATLYVALGAGAMVGLRAHGWKPVFFVLATVWASDSAAYYVGRKWGRRKLAPVVSPKKTVRGALRAAHGGSGPRSRSLSPLRRRPLRRLSARQRAFSSRASPSSGISSNPRSREAAP